MLTGNAHKNRRFKILHFEYRDHFMKLGDPGDEYFNADADVTDRLHAILNEDVVCAFDELNLPLTCDELQEAIKQLKCGKSGGEDLLLNEFFIYGFQELRPYLLNLFNYIFDNGIFPEAWSDGLMVPLHKKGNLKVLNNYRGITLLSVLGKLFTRILNNRLMSWAESYGIYVEAQYGFRPRRGTVDSIFIIHNVINKFIDEGQTLYTFFVDFSKAFDFVVHDNLWYKLLSNGISGKIFNVIRSMYSSMKTKVFSNGIISDPFLSYLGVRQGECLSPLLFSMYINDLENCLSSPNAGITIGHVRLLLLL